jgi:hypothetical protein
MTPIEFLLIYSIGGLIMFAAGYIIGSQRAESKAEQIRRWWFNRENRARKERK